MSVVHSNSDLGSWSSPDRTRNATANDHVRHARVGEKKPSADTSHGREFAVPGPTPFRSLVMSGLLKAHCFPGCPPLGRRFLYFQRVRHQTPNSALGQIPANLLPSLPLPLLLVNYPRCPRHNLRGNPHPAGTPGWCMVPRRTTQLRGTIMTLRNVLNVLLRPPSQFSHPSISELYLGPFSFGYLCHSSRRSTCRFPPSPGAILT